MINFGKIYHSLMESQLLSNQEFRRFQRQMMLSEIGVQGQETLKKSSVLVVGAGGLGTPVLKYLASAGVGLIGICDNDLVEESNLQRQILYGSLDLGKQKAIIAKERLEAYNHICSYNIHNIFVTAENAEWICAAYDVIVDATDNYKARYVLSDACAALKKPLVYGAIHEIQGQVTVFCYKGGPTLRDLFTETFDEKSAPPARDLGILGVLPGIVGSIQAAEVIKILTGTGSVLSGRLLLVDIMQGSFETYSFTASGH